DGIRDATVTGVQTCALPICTVVLTSRRTRIQRARLRGFEAGTAISCAHINGTSPQPSWRAAAAGNSAVRSGVVVNQAAAMSSGRSEERRVGKGWRDGWYSAS